MPKHGSSSEGQDIPCCTIVSPSDRHTSSVCSLAHPVLCPCAPPHYMQHPTQLSPGTRRILATKQALAANAGSPQSPTHRIQQDFLDRLQQQSLAQGALGCSPGGGGGEDTASPAGTTTSCGSSSRSAEKAGQGVRPVGAAGARGGGAGGSSGSSGSGRGGDCVLQECTFRPHITARAAARKGRSVEELSEGDRLRREVRLVSVGPRGWSAGFEGLNKAPASHHGAPVKGYMLLVPCSV
jgi:hypothetical protein